MPLSKVLGNNIAIDLSTYPLKTNVDTSLKNSKKRKKILSIVYHHYQKIQVIIFLFI